MRSKPPQGPYVPQIEIQRPEKPDTHVDIGPKVVDVAFDAKYPYLDESLGFKLWSGFIHFAIFTLVFMVCPIRYALRIEGRSILRKNRSLFNNGALTVANHVFRWDFLCVLQAVRYRRLYFPAVKENILSPDRNLIRAVGGIPIPSDIHAIRCFSQAFDELHRRKKWFHVFPEAASWDFYQPIRPFKKGMFTMAYQYNLPVIPMAFSYRPPTGIYRFFKKGYPLITLRIGEPILPDQSLPRKEAVTLLREQCHKKMVELAGIPEGENIWPCEGD
jgi:1-acyl-sn-glycerol-3-phosphate acyltransferase